MLQLAIGLPAQAMSLIGKVILSALSHGSTYEQGEAMLLQVKCKIAMADKSNKKEFEKSLPSFIGKCILIFSPLNICFWL
jgi:hypothetical protein